LSGLNQLPQDKEMNMTDFANLPTRAQPRFMRTPDAARYLGLSPRTLEKHRCYRTGPVYCKLGGRIVYAIEELERWAEIGTRRSTSDPGKGTVHPAKRIEGQVTSHVPR
jgi:Helix-turn-helix domain